MTATDLARERPAVGARVVARRAGWGLLDQALSSVTNFALSAFVAAAVSAAEFGAFAIVYAVYTFCRGLVIGLACTPLTIRFSAESGERLRAAERAAMGTAAAVGIGCGALCLAAAPFVGAVMRPSLIALGLLMPGLLAQDAWRFTFMARGEPRLAAVNDGFWALLQVVAIAVAVLAHRVSALSMVLAWGGAAVLAALYGSRQAGYRPSLRRSAEWVSTNRDLGPRYAAESIAQASGPSLAMAALGVVAGLETVAALRGGLLLVGGPLNLLFVGASLVALPEGVRLYHRHPQRLPLAAAALSGGMALIAAAWSVAILLLGGSVGRPLLGSTWVLAKPLLVFFAAFAVAQALSIGYAQGLRVLGAANRSLWTQVATVALLTAATTGGAVVDGARGACIGMVGTTTVSLLLRVWQFRVAFSQAVPPPTAGAAGDPLLTPGSAALPVHIADRPSVHELPEQQSAASYPRVIFVAGALRSGSTLFGRALGTIPGVLSLGEALLSWRAWHENRTCSCLETAYRCPFWTKMFAALEKDSFADHDRMRVLIDHYVRTRYLRPGRRGWWLQGVQVDEVAACLRRLYRAGADLGGVTTVVDTSKSPAALAMTLATGLPVHVIHLVRDPRAVAYSESRRLVGNELDPGPPARSPLSSVLAWVSNNELTCRVAGADRTCSYSRVQYEDFVRRPLDVASGLAERLALAGPAAIVPDGRGYLLSCGLNHELAGNPARLISGNALIRPTDNANVALGRLAGSLVSVLSAPTRARLQRDAPRAEISRS